MSSSVRESAADFPAPPGVVQQVSRRVRAEFNGQVIADTTNPVRIVEKDRPPVYYFPLEDVRQEFLVEEEKTST